MSRLSFQKKLEQAGAGARTLFVTAVILGLAAAVFWLSRHATGKNPVVAGSGGLSDGAMAVLKKLDAPVTIHFYTLLDKTSVPAATFAFAERVNDLLTKYQQAGDGKIFVTRFQKFSDADAASADGITPFNLDKGEACFLGLAVASGKNTEALARLQPEWEPALEFDLARAIQRVAATAAPAKPAPEVAKPSPEIIASINRLIPDVSAVSVEQADQIFHAEFVKQCAEVGTEVEAQINAAQQQVVNAQNSGSPADLEAAQKNLAQVQLAQGERLKEIAAQLPIRLAVFKQMKSASTNEAK